jgi:hypothetical protein
MATRDLRTPSILLVSNSVDERYVYTHAMRSSGYRIVLAETTILAYPRGRLSRQSPKFLRSVVDNARARNERTCPHCRGRMEYRHKSPVLSLEPESRAPRDRLRYVSGWFCSDPACDYRELAQFRG